MEDIKYIPNEDIVQGLGADDLIPVYKSGSSQSGAFNSERKFVQVNNFFTSSVDKTFAPTVTDEVNGTLTIVNFLIDKVGDIVTFSFAGRFDLAAATTSGGCNIDLPTAFQPTSNWAAQTDVNCIISRTNGIITAETKIIADDSGTKLLTISVNDTLAEASIRFSAVGRYKIA
jgi:hypothetical protein